VGNDRKYEVLSELGSGGCGTVYRGRLVGIGDFSKPVALKVLNPDVASVDEYASRLRDEARVLGLLRHRAIVHVDDLIRLHGTWAVVMEMVEGANLTEVCRTEHIPIGPALDITKELASALDVAHNALGPDGEPLHLLHRDVKPSNIRITPVGEVKILDFGIARAEFDSREALTRSLAWGSPEYLSPERHDFLDTTKGDVYGLGTVLFEALTGERFGRTSANAARHAETLEKRIPVLRRVVGDINEPITAFVCAMLSFNPDDRPTAREVERKASTLRRDHPEPLLRDWAERVVPIANAAHEEQAVDPSKSSQLASSSEGEIVLTVATSTSAKVPVGAPKWPGEAPSIPAPAIETIATQRGASGREFLGRLLGGLLVAAGAMWWWQSQFSPAPTSSEPAASEVTEVRTAPEEVSETTAPNMETTTQSALPPSKAPTPATSPLQPSSTQQPLPKVTPNPVAQPQRTPPAPPPTVVETAPKPTGTVEITGTAHAVRLSGPAGVFQAGTVPSGTYAVQAQFSDGGDWINASSIEVIDGAEHTLECLNAFQRCKTK